MGLYSMQYDVFDLRPTYVQNRTKPGRQPAYLYYDSSSMAWKIGSSIGEGRAVYIYARSTASRPDFVTSTWKMFSREANKFVPMNPVKATCADSGGKGKPAVPPEPLQSDSASQCQMWQPTADCDPEGAKSKHKKIRKCGEIISDHDAGYCLCANRRRVKFACGHTPFRCVDKCKVTFPMVIAQSGERVWTNQLASNLVQHGGDWMTSATKDQWVIFDLGMAHSLKSLTLMLWGSEANPRRCQLQSASHQFGPWSPAARFEVESARSTIAKKIVTSTVKARFWRLTFVDNWGAQWGMGLNQVSFAFGEPGPTPAPRADTCGTYKSCTDCVYKSMLQDEENCGWCGGSNTCMSGYPHQPANGKCSEKWMWTTCSTVDPCEQFRNCTSCSARAECGWCDSSALCKSGDCKRWGQRNCKYDMMGHELQHLYAVAATGSTEFWTPATTAATVGGGLIGATAICIILFQWKRRKSRFRMRLGELREGGSQYEMEDTQQYDDFAEAGGAYGATASDSAQLLAEQTRDGGQEDVI
eukprot:g564.t1